MTRDYPSKCSCGWRGSVANSLTHKCRPITFDPFPLSEREVARRTALLPEGQEYVPRYPWKDQK